LSVAPAVSLSLSFRQVACLQLCDKGMASLDDADLVRRHVPELEATQVITGFDERGNAQMEGVRNTITLRLLLSHTSGELRVGGLGHHIGLERVETNPGLPVWSRRR
jgi:CubicO group peptidase (beta-lactamase class C family)